MIARLAPFLLLALAAPVPAQLPAPPPPAAPGAIVDVVMQTTLGPIAIALQPDKAPITVANFLRYVDRRRLDGITFYRAVKVPGIADQGLVQAGAQNDPARLLPPIAHEPTSRTGLRHVDGTISMARAAPGSATADFFIILGDMPYMDADPAKPGDNLGYAAFGRVTQGLDIAKRILAAPTSDAAPIPEMKGQMLAAPVRILTIRRAAAAPAVTPSAR